MSEKVDEKTAPPPEEKNGDTQDKKVKNTQANSPETKKVATENESKTSKEVESSASATPNGKNDTKTAKGEENAGTSSTNQATPGSKSNNGAEPPQKKQDADDGSETMFLVEQLLDEQERVRILTEELEVQKAKVQAAEARNFLSHLREAGTTPWTSEVIHCMSESQKRVQQEGMTSVFRGACLQILHLVTKAKKQRSISIGNLRSNVIDLLFAHDADIRKAQQLQTALRAQQIEEDPHNAEAHQTPSIPTTGTLTTEACIEEYEAVLSVRVELLSLLTHGSVPPEYHLADNSAVTSSLNSSPERSHEGGNGNAQDAGTNGKTGHDGSSRTPPPLRLLAPTIGTKKHTSLYPKSSLLQPVSGRRTSSSTPRPRLQTMNSAAMNPPPTVVFTVESKKATGPVSSNVRSRYADPADGATGATNGSNAGEKTPPPRQTSSSPSVAVRTHKQTPGRRGAPMASEYDDEDDEDAEWEKLASMNYRPRNTALGPSAVVTTSRGSSGSSPRASSALKKKRTSTTTTESSRASSSKPRHVGFA